MLRTIWDWKLRYNLNINMTERLVVIIYYSSKLAEQISNDSYGIENMDAKYLAEDLIENEPVLTMVRLRKYNKKYTKCIYFSFERDIIPLRRV